MALVTATLNSDDILAAINEAKGEIMTTISEVAQQFATGLAEVKAGLAPLADAVNALEAKLTQLSQDPSVPQASMDVVNAALGDLATVKAGLGAVTADAADGVDEAATPPAGEPTP